jgi:hypothetical protein
MRLGDFLPHADLVFSLHGANNAVEPDIDRLPLPECRSEFTLENHFRFGFDGEAFNNRRCGAARYWVEYGRPRRLHQGFARELERALTAIAERAGRFAIAGSAEPAMTVAAALARRLGLDALITLVEIEGDRPMAIDAGLPVERFRASFDEFAAFAAAFATRAGCGDPWVALAAFRAALSEYPVVDELAELRVVDNGYDARRWKVVGPASLTLVDNERFTAVNRWLIAEGRDGYPSLLRWSPELMAAQLDSTPWRDWLAEAMLARHAPGFAYTNLAARHRLLAVVMPELPERRVLALRHEPAFIDRMAALGRRMRRANPGCREQHHLPLHRLATQLEVHYAFSVGDDAAAYGAVGAAAAEGREA